MSIRISNKGQNPWYREPWPWILMGLPGTVVVAGIVTMVIATRNADGLVAEDYYKEGMAINQVLERESNATNMGLSAQFMFSGNRIRVRLEGETAPAKTLVARFIHPVRADDDKEVVLQLMTPGWYEAMQPQLNGVRWRIQLEDADGKWRLSGTWTRPEPGISLTGHGDSQG